jgi:hypothetical protein
MLLININIIEHIIYVGTLVNISVMACFINEDFVRQKYLQLLQRANPTPCEVINRHIFTSIDVTHETQPLKVHMNEFISNIMMNIISHPQFK